MEIEQILREKLLNEQDYLFFNIFKFYMGKPKEIGNMANLILEKNELLQMVKSKNLFYLLNSIEIPREKRRIIIDEILRRKDQDFYELFSSGLLENEMFFGARNDSYNFNGFSKNEIDEFKNPLVNRIKSVENEELKQMLYDCSLYSAPLFFNYYDKGVFTQEKIDTLKKLFNENNNIMGNLNFGIFRDEIYSLGEDYILAMAKSPNICTQAIMLLDNDPKLYDVCKTILLENKDKDLQLKLQLVEKIFNYSIDNHNKFRKYPYIDHNKYLECCLNGWYYANLVPSDKILTGYDGVNYDELYTSSKKLEDKKNIFSNKNFSLSFSELKKFLDKYNENKKDLKELDNSNQVFDILKYMEYIYFLEDENELNNNYMNPKYSFNSFEMLEFDNLIRRMYAKTFVYVLNRTNSEIQNKKNNFVEEHNEYEINKFKTVYDKFQNKNIMVKEIGDSVIKDSYDGKEVTIIPMHDNFNFLITSTDTGYKGKKEIKNNSFVDTYKNIDDTNVDKTSTTYIDNNNLGVAPLGSGGVYYAYTSVPSEFINIMGNTDVNSHIRELSFKSAKIKTFGASSISDNIRQVYGEVVIKKTSPDYVVLFNDATEDVIINSYKAASEWNIPIVYIDKTKVLNNQINNLEVLLELFESTCSIELLEEIVSTYESNVSGYLLNKNKNENDDSMTASINNEKYNKILIMEGKITATIRDLIINSNDEVMLNEVIRILEAEKNKYGEQVKNLSKTELSFNVDELIELATYKNDKNK